MRQLAPIFALLVLGCASKSNLEPGEPLDALDVGETAQLCRFTVDVLAGADTSCDPDAPGALMAFESCTSDPPWDACPPPAGAANNIASWEDCVNALAGAVCDAETDARCWHFRCR